MHGQLRSDRAVKYLIRVILSGNAIKGHGPIGDI